MSTDVTIKIGGGAGQGIQTVGQLLALSCHAAGLYLLGINDFESRIHGGHSFFQLRISDSPVRAADHRVHMLVAMDEATVELHQAQVVADGIILADREQATQSGKVLAVPVARLAGEAGSAITANTVAAGAALALLGAPIEIFQAVLAKQFKHKNEKILAENVAAAKLGYAAVQGISFAHAVDWSGRTKKGQLVEGAQALALGALAGDCRFAAFYPMSPATGIMMHLAAYQDGFPLVVEQAEDEIAAVNMSIGASFAGARALTATAGGGFCLMTEGLGLAGITETPLVIINGQRPGPATGLATRTAQGDLLFVIRAAQDDFPRFVFAPGTPAEAFETTARALHLAEKYQVPAIILVDQYFNDSLYVSENGFAAPSKIERMLCAEGPSGDPAQYKRYRLTESGISPRRLPCRGEELVMATGNEHREDGHTSEAITDRIAQVRKRAAKQNGMLAEMHPCRRYHGDAALLLVGWGSTDGVLREAVDMLRRESVDAGCLHFCDLWPFPVQATMLALATAEKFFVVEQNSTGQFAQLLRQQTGLVSSGSILKYDGRPFYPEHVRRQVLEHMG